MTNSRVFAAAMLVLGILWAAPVSIAMAGQIIVDANGDGTPGDIYRLAIESYDPEGGPVSVEIPIVFSPDRTFNANKIVVSLKNGVFEGSDFIIYRLPDGPELPFQCVKESAGDKAVCTLPPDRRKYDEPYPIIKAEQYSFFENDNWPKPPIAKWDSRLVEDEDVFQVYIHLYDDSDPIEDSVYVYPESLLARFDRQYAACPATIFYDPPNQKQLTLAEARILDKNVEDSSDVTVTDCTYPLTQDSQVGTFIPFQQNGSFHAEDDIIPQMKFIMKGQPQAGISHVRCNFQTVAYDPALGGWACSQTPGNFVPFEIVRDGATSVSPATFTLDVVSDAGATNPITYLSGAVIGKWVAGFEPDIRVNNHDGPLTAGPEEPLNVSIGIVDAGGQDGLAMDWWVGIYIPALDPGGWFTYVDGAGWKAGLHPFRQTAAETLDWRDVLTTPLPAGTYYFFFIMDQTVDGAPQTDWLDVVTVTVE